MSFPQSSFERDANRTAQDALFWLLFVIDLCVMQYLFAFVLVTPFALLVAGAVAMKAWGLLLFFQLIYAAGLIYACVIRKRRTMLMVAVLLVTPVVTYGSWYLVTKAGWLPPALGIML